jgi:putative hydroxymethylpyrimidine transport system substrate-binding protein
MTMTTARPRFNRTAAGWAERFVGLALVGLAAAVLLAKPAPAADKLTVLLDWFVNPDHAPLVVAKEGGFFARHGLDVDLIAPADASSPPRLVAAGKADIAVTYQPDLMLQVKAGLPLVRFGTLIDMPLNCMIVPADGPIQKIADLKGKKIGYSIPGFQEAYLAEMLASAGLTMADVTLINLNFNLVSALMSGQVDAVVGGFRNFEPIELAVRDKPARVFLPEDYGVPPYDELIYVAAAARKDDPRLPRFLAAVKEATAYIAANPGPALALFFTQHKDIDDDLDRRAFADTLPRFAKDPAALDRARYASFAAFMKAGGLIDTVPPLASYAVEVK